MLLFQYIYVYIYIYEKRNQRKTENGSLFSLVGKWLNSIERLLFQQTCLSMPRCIGSRGEQLFHYTNNGVFLQLPLESKG